MKYPPPPKRGILSAGEDVRGCVIILLGINTVLEQIWPQRAPRLGGGPTPLSPVLEDTLPDLVHDLDVHFMIVHPSVR